MEYNQPDFYHFSRDSIELSNHVLECEQNILSLLDVCAGCGVVGIEIARSAHSLEQCDFVEIQSEFSQSLWENQQRYLESCDSEIFFKSLKEFEINHVYDVIVANPPYFHPNKSRPSANEKRNRCRSLIDLSLEDLLIFFEREALKGSHCYFTGLKEWQLKNNLCSVEKDLSDQVVIYSMKKDNIS